MIKRLFLFLFLVHSGCSGIYYSAMEKLGYPKRDILVSRVQEARESQQEGKEQFRSALERFKSIVNFSGGKLEEKYETLNSELERSEHKAEEIHARITSVEDVADALFKEWKSELRQYKNQEFRSVSERKLKETERRSRELIAAMKKAEQRIQPFLDTLRDNVLFLKHNLNAEAIGSLAGELQSVEGNADSLVRELERSIDEADRFIAEMRKE